MQKILITGATGFLARALVPIASSRASIIGVARKIGEASNHVNLISLDLSDAVSVEDVFRSIKPDAIIHCAACNPGGSEAEMTSINDIGTRNVAQAAANLGCRLVSVSSDTVLDGENAPYTDGAVASPLPGNSYAVTKALGESHVLSLAPESVVVRTSLIYGTESIDRGTAGFATRLAKGEPLKLFTDVIRQPVFDQSLAQGLCDLALLHVNEHGVINIAGNEVLSRYEFGVRMLDFWGIDYANQLNEVKGAGIIGLPLDLRLDLTRARTLGIPTPGVSETLRAARQAN